MTQGILFCIVNQIHRSEIAVAVYTRLIIERKTSTVEWEVFAYPRNEIDEAKRVLGVLREAEEKKRYKKPLRLVRETREYLDC